MKIKTIKYTSRWRYITSTWRTLIKLKNTINWTRGITKLTWTLLKLTNTKIKKNWTAILWLGTKQTWALLKLKNTKNWTWQSTEGDKWYLSLNMDFFKYTSPGIKTDPAVTFRSKVFKSIETHELDYQFHVRYNQTVLQIDKFQRNGSGWVIDHLQHLNLGTCFL